MRKGPAFFEKYSVNRTKESIFVPFLKTASRRLFFISFLFFTAYLIVVLRLFNVMVFSKEEKNPFQESKHASVVRGNIYDRNHQLLATSLTTYSLYANPKQISDPEGAAKQITSFFKDLSYADVLQKIKSPKSFVWIKRNLPPQEQQAVLELGIPGVYFQKEAKRVYPQGSLTAHVVGLTDVDGHGIAGVEKSLSEILSVQQKTVHLALDVRVQHIVMDEVAKSVQHFSAKGGGGIVMDIKTGELLALVSYPTFDPHQLSAATKEAMFNFMTSGVHEFGSVMKTATTVMALEAQKANLYTLFDATQPIAVGRHKIKDFKPQNRIMPLWEVFMYSSNIGFSKMVQMVGIEGQKEFLKRLGFLNKPSLELIEIGKPIVPKVWREVNGMTIGYGYGLAISPVQVVRFVGSILNAGTMIEPTLLRRDIPLVESQKIKVMSDETARLTRALMRLVVTNGTGKKASVPGYEVFGKTGTANHQINGRYHDNHVTASFVGGFPFANPRYLVLVMLNDPKSTPQTHGYTTAGWNSAPLASNIISRMAPLLGVQPTYNDAVPEQDYINLIQTKAILNENR